MNGGFESKKLIEAKLGLMMQEHRRLKRQHMKLKRKYLALKRSA